MFRTDADRIAIVTLIKADLEARHVSLVGPCGAFQIVKRVAWTLSDEHAGLLVKGGNNCEGFATDIICYPDGRIFDILANGGGDEDANHNPIPGTGNVPVWNPPSDGLNVDPSRYRPAFDPGDVVVPPKEPPDPQQPPGDSLDDLALVLREVKAIEGRLDARLEAIETGLGAAVEDIEAARTALKTAIDEIRTHQNPNYSGRTVIGSVTLKPDTK